MSLRAKIEKARITKTPYVAMFCSHGPSRLSSFLVRWGQMGTSIWVSHFQKQLFAVATYFQWADDADADDAGDNDD